MITAQGPKLIEYNVRFGDPECQVLMLRLMSDLVPALIAARDGQLKNFDLRWYDDAALVVVMAAKGYPGNYGKGSVIGGLDAAAALEDVEIFHAGTKAEGGRITANGGRVLGVCGHRRDGRARRRRAPMRRSTRSTGRAASAGGISAISRSRAKSPSSLAIRPCHQRPSPLGCVPGETHDHDRPPGRLYRHQGRGGAAALRCGAAGGLSRGERDGLHRPADGASSSRAASRTRPTCWKRRRANTCCGASRRASCCPRRTRSIASSASISALHAQGFPVAEPVVYCADESVTGTAFYVMGFVEGRVFWDAGHAGLEPGRARRGLSTR